MRTKIVAGNWKMHKNAEETEDLINELIAKL
jgi:triosephosphate isomerase (TIM)